MKLRSTLLLIAALACLVRCASAGPSLFTPRSLVLAPSEFEARTDVSLRRSQLRAVVVCEPSGYSYVEIPTGLAERITHELGRRGLNVVPQSKVEEFLSVHPEWTTAAEIGDGVRARFVVRVDVKKSKPFRADVSVREVYGLEYSECIFSRSAASERGCWLLFCEKTN